MEETKNYGNVFTFSPFGYEGSLVMLETDCRRGIPATDIVGLADGAVKESRERTQAAIRNSGLEYPTERVLISLSPADLRKEGSGMDAAIAVSVLNAKNISEGKKPIVNENVMVLGELELSGKLRPVNGCFAAAQKARENGIEKIICPKQNAHEIKSIEGLKVAGVEDLNDAISHIRNNDYDNKNTYENPRFSQDVIFNEEGLKYWDEQVPKTTRHIDTIRALSVAIAGKHNIDLVGAPGCGKTMWTQHMFTAFLPDMTYNEAQAPYRIRSIAGLTRPNEGIDYRPMFRMPHQTASIEGICGGGPNCRPGEISLAHNGVLFLDEAAEFRSSVLQMLRVPLENHNITLSRAGRTTVYPANFQLAMANNPCPCGNFGDNSKICLCSLKSIEQYYKKFSAPLMDRVEIKHFVESDGVEKRTPTSAEIKEMIKNAYEIQRKNGCYNRDLEPYKINEIINYSPKEVQDFLNKSTEKYFFSLRQVNNTVKVAQTIANMDKRENINLNDITEAVQYSKDGYNFNTNELEKEVIFSYDYDKKNPEIQKLEEQKDFLEKSAQNFSIGIIKGIEKTNEGRRIIINEELTRNFDDKMMEKFCEQISSLAEKMQKENSDTNENTKKSTKGRK